MGSKPSVLAREPDKNCNDVVCSNDRASDSKRSCDGNGENIKSEEKSDEKSDEKSEEKSKNRILEYHGYTSGRFIGSGSYATVKVVYNNRVLNGKFRNLCQR